MQRSALAEATPQGGTAAAVAILLLTFVLALVWSHAKLLWNDEFLSYYTDSVPTLADVVHVQLHSPISLDPPTYHLLSHLAMGILGHTATALRLPAMLGFLLLQWSLFVLVRRLAGSRAGLCAMALPLCTASFRYAVEGRPYGLLLGLYAASVACWYFAVRLRDDTHAEATGALAGNAWMRTGPLRALLLIGLFLCICFAITSHYFGVLILLPVCAAELVRSVRRRQVDGPMLASLGLGVLSVGLILPFKAALKPYQAHYYTSTVNLRNVSQGYRELFVRYNAWPMAQQHIAAMLLAIAALALLVAVVRRFRGRPPAETAALWTALAMLALLPLFGYLFGRFVTHSMEVRYVIAALIPFAISIALLLARPLQSTRVFALTLGTILLLGIGLTVAQVRGERAATAQLLAGLQATTPAAQSNIGPIYIQTLSDFFLRTAYTADPTLRSRYVLLYDAARELRWLHHDTNAVTARNMQHFTSLRTADEADLPGESPSALFLVAPAGGWNWLLPDLTHNPALRVTPLGHMGDMELVRVTWPAASAGT